MKNGILILGLTAFILLGCKKDGSSILATKMSATIDGTEWNSTARATIKNDNGFVITATQINAALVTSTLVIRINGFNTGTYSLSLTSTGCLATYTPDTKSATDSYVSATGTVDLTEVNTSDKTISGTFEFTCANISLQTVSITNGSFTDLKYEEVSGN